MVVAGDKGVAPNGIIGGQIGKAGGLETKLVAELPERLLVAAVILIHNRISSPRNRRKQRTKTKHRGNSGIIRERKGESGCLRRESWWRNGVINKGKRRAKRKFPPNGGCPGNFLDISLFLYDIVKNVHC